jgi:transcriptional regulator with XRE-family HTH domain
MGRTSDLTPEQNERVRAALRELAMQFRSQGALAKRLGIAPASLSRLLGGKFGASLELAGMVATMLGVEVVTLLGGDSASLEYLTARIERSVTSLKSMLLNAEKEGRDPVVVPWACVAIGAQLVALDAEMNMLLVEHGELLRRHTGPTGTPVEAVEPGDGIWVPGKGIPTLVSMRRAGEAVLMGCYGLISFAVEYRWKEVLGEGLLGHLDFAAGIYERWKDEFILPTIAGPQRWEVEERIATIERLRAEFRKPAPRSTPQPAAPEATSTSATTRSSKRSRSPKK